MRMSSRRPVLLSGLLLLAGLLIPGLAATGRAASPSPSAGPNAGHHLAQQFVAASAARGTRSRSATETVSLQLAPRDAAGLAALAKTGPTMPRAARFARLDAVIAGPDRAAQVARVLRGLGLTVTASTDYAVSARGPAARVNTLFGSARDHNPRLATAQTLPVLPADLTGLVTAGWGGDDTRPAQLPHAVTRSTAGTAEGPSDARAPSDGTLSVAQARSMYGISATTTPPTSASPIVATLQFSTWPTQSTDLANYALTNGIYASGYNPSTGVSNTTISDNCGSTNDDNNGNIEVALDQETLLTVAPQLRQRIYVAPNCGNTQNEAIAQVVTDVQNGQPIVALSTSWGRCEEGTYGDQAEATADQQAVQSALALGVTVFAASGDSGSYDCLDDSGNVIAADAVDAPAAVPGVVAVGGTALTGTGATTTWNDVDGSSGGGFSCGVFARPTYQATVAQAARYPHNGFGCPAGAAERQVPDISADGGDGLDVIVDGETEPIVGTSFAAPLSAGGMAQTLSTLHIGQGLGNITSLLYTRAGLADVTTGSNGDYGAAVGYDEATGLGTPRWPSLLTGGVGANLLDARVNSSGFVTVRSVLAAAGWHTGSPTVTTPLNLGLPSQWQLRFGPYGGDGANDLWGIRLVGGASGKIELHVLSQASGYQTYLTHTATAQAARSPAATQVRLGSYRNDHASDVFLVFTSGTGSGHLEVHILSAASRYATFVGHFATPAAPTTTGWAWLIGDAANAGNLVGVQFGASASGRTEVHSLSASSNYHSSAGATATAMGLQSTDGSAQFSLRDVSGDGVPDLVLALLAGTASGTTELHAAAGTTYHTSVLAVATALTTLPTTDWVAMPE